MMLNFKYIAVKQVLIVNFKATTYWFTEFADTVQS